MAPGLLSRVRKYSNYEMQNRMRLKKEGHSTFGRSRFFRLLLDQPHIPYTNKDT
jgi:hypothetical protein